MANTQAVITQTIKGHDHVVIILRSSPWRVVLTPGQADWLAELLTRPAAERERLMDELTQAADRARWTPDTTIALADQAVS